MSIGKQVRLGRLFSHPSGRLCSVAVDHLVNYSKGRMPEAIRNISRTLELVVAGRPDAVTMNRGIAASAWGPHAGKVPFILQSSLVQPDDSCHDQIAGPEDAVRLGADAIAVVAFVRGPTESRYLKTLADCVAAAARFDLPVVNHVYPRKYGKEVSISYEPEDVAWAVRASQECGADVIKVPYPNDVAAYGQIVSECSVPVVAAGGPKTRSFEEALAMLRDVTRSGARGATVGRNAWGFEKVTEAVRAIALVIHDGADPIEAMHAAGLR